MRVGEGKAGQVDRCAGRYLGAVCGEHTLNPLLSEGKCSGLCKLNTHCQVVIENFVKVKTENH